MPWRRFFRWLGRLLSRKRNLSIGLVGAPNSGKTMLANRICMDWCGEEMGEVSELPHETRVVQSRNHVEIKDNGHSLKVELFDTPGLSNHDDLLEYYRHFIFSGLSKEHADKRLEEARRGMEHTLSLLNHLDAVILVLDMEKEPFKQVSEILLDVLDRKKIPLVIAASKIDLVEEKPPEDEYTFLGYPVVPVSALKGTNMEKLYKAIYQHLKK